MTYTILAADKLADEGLAFIENQPNMTLLNKPGLSEAEYADLLAAGGIDAMIVRSGIKVTPEVIANPGDLKIIARAGVGVDNINLPAATEKGILVVNTAEASTITTAEHAFALLMAMFRNIGPAYKTMTEGGWDRSKYKGRQLAGKKIGVVGFGRIGQTVAARALAFEMEVVGYDPFYAAETALDGQVKMFRDFKAMLPDVDILTFHVPLNDATRGILNDDTFALCKDGVYVVNAARGGVVDEDAAAKALDSGKCAGVAFDVFTQEPPVEDHPLRTHPKALITPHLGASTVEAQTAVSVEAAKICISYLESGEIRGAVNASGLRFDLDPLQTAFVGLADRMADLINPMITRGIARVEVEIRGKGLEPARTAVERTALVGLLDHYLDTPVNVLNVMDVAANRGITIETKLIDENPTDGPQLTLEIFGPPEAVDLDTPADDKTRRIVGRVFEDLKPRIVEINQYRMDMVPAGNMVILLNEDRPGMIGTVGSAFGKADVNIADMSISRRENTDGNTRAMMVLKIDGPPPEALATELESTAGILKIACVQLVAE